MANIKLKNLLICEDAVVAKDGKLSVINIFTEIKSENFPAMHPKLTIISMVTGDNGSYDERIEIISPDNETISKVDGKAEILGPDGSGFLANFINLPFLKEGKFWIKVSIDGSPITSKDDYFILVKKNSK